MNSSLPEISVIIPFHGEKNDLLHCVKELRNQNFDYPFEIIVVESGNDINIKELINPGLNENLISSPSLLFPGKARNIGAANSSANFLAFIDADCIPVPGWLDEVYTSLKKGNDIVIGPVINLYPLHPIASVDNLIQFFDFQKRRTSKNITHFAGCNLGITKDMFLKSGRFPEEINIAEDTKLSETAIKNYKANISFNQKMIVRHSGRKKFISFLNHHKCFGYYRGYSKYGITSSQNKLQSSLLYSFYLGVRRLLIISIRTFQWNPAGIIRIIFYFPFLVSGLSAWVIGFWKGNHKSLKGKS